MFDLVMCGKIGGDCTAPYAVILEKSYTVRTFIDAVLTRNNEWGSIKICHGPSCQYRHGELITKMQDDVLNKAVIKVTAGGGWSNMDYTIKI